MIKDYKDRVISFIQKIGIQASLYSLEEDTFLNGIKIDCGKLLYDPENIISYGDRLHEAGHIALMKS